MDRRFLTVLSVSLLFALVISGVFYQLVAGPRRARKPVKIDKRDLVVAARALPVGIVLKDTDLKLVQVPVDQFPAGCFSKFEQVADRPVALSILAGEPVREGRLAPRGSGLGLAPAIPAGMRAVAVKVNEVVGVAGFALPGMRVDVLATGRLPDGSGTVSKTVLQDILVLSAGQTIEPSSTGQAINAPVVTLLVTPKQAETLTVACEWKIQLVLRNGADRAIEKTHGRELADLFGGARKPEPAPMLPILIAPKPAAAPATPPKPADEVVMYRGVQKTVEQVGVRTP
jgi:pilus assembly protein CpaB